MSFRFGLGNWFKKLTSTSLRKAKEMRRQQRRRTLMLEGLEGRKLLAFTPGNLVVLQVGDGTSSLDAAAQPVALLEFTPGGGSGTTVHVPSTGAGRLTVTGNNSTAEGAITLSQDGKYLHVVGYSANAGALNVAGTSTTGGSAVPRLIGRIGANETIDLTTSTTDFSGNSIRSAASVDGSRFWITGPNQTNSRLRTTTYGSSGAATGVTTTGNLRVAQIFDDQLYVSVNNAIMKTADPLPASSSTLNTVTLNMGPASRDFFDFVFLNRDSTANGDGYDTLYIADPTNGVLKYSSTDGTNWTYRQVVSGVKGTGIEAIVNGSVAEIYATNGTLSGNSFVKFTDATNYDASIVASSQITIATAATNSVFRGVSQSPAAASSAPSIVDQPSDASITYGEDTAFTASATGTPLPTVQWQTFVGGNWIDIDSSTDGGIYSNFTTDTLTVTKPGVALSSRTFRAHYVNSAGTANTNAVSLTVSALGITATGTASNRVYNGSTGAITSVELIGVLPGDEVAATVSGEFANKQVGVGKTVALSGYVLSGASAANYTISTSNGTTTADITAKPLTATGTASSKVYDANTAASTSVTLAGVVSGDTVTGSVTGTFVDKHVGAGKTVNLTGYTLGGADGANYAVTGNPTATANITAKAIDIVGFTAQNKVYDGTVAAAFTVTLSGVIAGDAVTPIGFGQFVTKTVGVNKPVVYEGTTLSGADGGNYTLNLSLSPPGQTANITAKLLTATGSASDKVYDGTVDAATSVSLAGIVNGDVVTATVTGAFVDKHVGIGKTVNLSGYTLAGVDSGNYSVTGNSTTTADIHAKELTASGTASHKVYDGGVSASTAVVLSGVVSGEDVSATVTGAFSDKHVATGKTVALSAYVLSGADANNYTVVGNATTTANITALALVMTAVAASKNYDGDTSSSGVPTFAPDLVEGDTSAFIQTYDSALVGAGKTLTPSGLVNDGNGGNNYSYTFVSNANGTIVATNAAPTLSSVLINDSVVFLSSTQRSQVVSLRVTFSGMVQVDPEAFTLTNLGLLTAVTTSIPQNQILYSHGAGTSFVITFGAADVPVGTNHNGIIRRAGDSALSVSGNSLADGNYRLTIDPTKVRQADGQSLAGSNVFGAAQNDKFFRMFGDSDGDGDVDGTDTLAFRRALAIYNAALDWDGGGAVTNNSSDSTNFGLNNSKKRRNIGS